MIRVRIFAKQTWNTVSRIVSGPDNLTLNIMSIFMLKQCIGRIRMNTFSTHYIIAKCNSPTADTRLYPDLRGGVGVSPKMSATSSRRWHSDPVYRCYVAVVSVKNKGRTFFIIDSNVLKCKEKTNNNIPAVCQYAQKHRSSTFWARPIEKSRR